MGVDLVQHAKQRILGVLAQNPFWEATSRLDESPPERVPRSLSWVVEDEDRLAQVVFWDDGQSETDLADAGTGEVRTESRLLSGPADVNERLNTIREWLRTA